MFFPPLLIVCVLILPNNFSTAALVFINGLVLMFIGKIKLNYILKILSAAVVAASLIYGLAKFFPDSSKNFFPRSTTWVSRIDSYFIDNGNEINE